MRLKIHHNLSGGVPLTWTQPGVIFYWPTVRNGLVVPYFLYKSLEGLAQRRTPDTTLLILDRIKDRADRREKGLSAQIVRTN